MCGGPLPLPIEAIDSLAAGREDFRPAVAIDVLHVAAVNHRQCLVDLPHRPRLAFRMGRQAERPEVGRFHRLEALRARTKKRNVHQFRPAIAVQVAPANAMGDRILGNGMNLPRAVEIPAGFQPLQIAPLRAVVEVKPGSQHDLRPAVAVDVIGRHVDIGRRSGNDVLLPRRVFVPHHEVLADRQNQHVGPAIAVDVGDRRLIAVAKIGDLMTLKLRRRQQPLPQAEQGRAWKAPRQISLVGNEWRATLRERSG